jgi:hypothetical protein
VPPVAVKNLSSRVTSLIFGATDLVNAFKTLPPVTTAPPRIPSNAKLLTS